MKPSQTRAGRKRAAKKAGAAKAAVPEAAESGVEPPAAPAAPERPDTVVLGPSCTLREAVRLRGELLTRLDVGEPVRIDGAAVERVDTAGIQLLVGFAIDCMERGIVFSWTARSALLEEAIRLLGVGALLESPGAAVSFAGVSA